MKKFFIKAKQVDKSISKTWFLGTGIMWVVIVFAAFYLTGTEINDEKLPPKENEPTIINTAETVPYFNCKKSAKSDIVLDTSPLKTNTKKGKYDLIEDTEKGVENKNEIPAIYNPQFMSLFEAKDCLDLDSPVYYLTYKGITKVYPKAIMNYHQIVNDNFASTMTGSVLESNKKFDQDIIVTYSPFADSPSAYLVKGQRFGVSGRLLSGATLMFDEKTETLWNQVDGKAVIGDMTGKQLIKVPIYEGTFEDVTKNFKFAYVLSFETGYTYPYETDPYENFHKTDQIIGNSIGIKYEGIGPKEKVVIVSLNKVNKAYKLSDLDRYDINDKIAKSKLIIFDNSNTNSINARLYNKNDVLAEFIPVTEVYWYTWKSLYPETEIYVMK